MENVKIVGTQKFMGKSIPIMVGGFGPDTRCIYVRALAEIYDVKMSYMCDLITQNRNRLCEGVDYIDLINELLMTLGGARQSAKHVYFLSSSGYRKLSHIMNDASWEQANHFLNEYFQIDQEAEQTSQQAEEAVSQQMDMRQAIVISPTEWRKETKELIARIAQAIGTDYEDTYLEIFDLFEQRTGVSLKTRLDNKRRRMAKLGVDATKCKSVTRIDVIADDKKLIEIYIAIVKEVAIRYGVGVNT